MALITKTIVTCNKCGDETVVPEETPGRYINGNVVVAPYALAGTETQHFFLCKECLERLLGWLDRPADKTPLPTLEYGAITLQNTEKKHKRTTCNIKWDEYNLDKLFNLLGQNYTDVQLAEAFATSTMAIASTLHRIRKAEVGSQFYSYKSRLERLDMMRHNKLKEQEETE